MKPARLHTFFCHVTLALLVLPSLSFATGLEKTVNRGWFWYEDPEELAPPVAPVKPVSPPLKPEEKPFTLEWIQKNYPILLNKAIDDPNPENVANVAYVQRVFLDKSQIYAKNFNQAVKTDPFLDEENRVPSASYSNIAFTRGMDKERKTLLQYLATQGGIWVVIDKPEKCSACNSYLKVAKSFATEFGFPFKVISMTTPEGVNAARNLNLKVTPTTIFAKPPNEAYLISQGLLAKDQLKDRLLVASNAYKLAPKELEENANPYDKSLLVASDLNGISSAEDPSVAVANLRKKIGATQPNFTYPTNDRK